MQAPGNRIGVTPGFTRERAVGQGRTLIATKLHVPPPRAEAIVRPQLLARLDRTLHSKLTLIGAPAGFGKTSLASAWIEARGIRVGWISLDATDNDPAHFWAYLLAALGPHLSATDLVLPAAAEARVETALIPLVNALATLTDDLVLALDDYHLITAESIHRGVTFLLEHVPPRMHLLILSRYAPPLPLARLRARGELEELGASDLSFSLDETAAYLNAGLGLRLADSDLRALADRTEGWAAGLHLAALVMRRHPSPVAVVDELRGSHSMMFDYLTSEVLSQLQTGLQEFLLHTSILDRLCADLCDELVPTGRAQQLLEELLNAGLFLVPLDDRRSWFRYHHLFADMLRSMLRQREPQAAFRLHAVAAAWFERHGFAAEAVHHALEARDWDHAAALIEREAPAMIFTRGEPVTLIKWQQRFPEEQLYRRPRLCLLFARALLPLGRSSAAELLASAVERQDAQTPLADDVRGLLLAVHTRLAFGRDENDRCEEAGRAARALIPQSEMLLRSDVTVTLASALYLRGAYEEVIELCREVIADGRAISYNGVFWVAVGVLATTCDILGRLHEGERLCTQVLQQADQLAAQGLPPMPFVGHVLIARGFIRWEQFRLEEAAADLAAGIRRLLPTGSARSLFLAYLQLMLTCHLIDDEEARIEATRETELWLARADSSHMHVLYQATLAHIALIRGDYAGAARWSVAAGAAALSITARSAYLREYEQLLRAWRTLVFGQPELALDLLAAPMATAESGGRLVIFIEALALRAMVLDTLGDREGALAALARAVALSEPDHITRPLIEKGSAMRELLLALRHSPARPAQISLPYLHLLLNALGDTATPAPAAPAAAAPALLTPREHEVMRLLAAGASNRAIAGALVISEETVKTYLKQIYRKLEVATRTQAIARARQLGLL